MPRLLYQIGAGLFRDWLFYLPAGSGQVALTFDDGPNRHTTPILLKTLDRCCLKATMFLNGSACGGCEAIVRETASAGHVIANHGYFHKRHAFWSAAHQTNSIRAANDAILKTGVKPSPLFRPPYGLFNFMTPRVLSRLGMRGVLWSTAAHDWIPGRASLVWKELENGLHDGAIIILHDGHESVSDLASDILPRLSDEIREKGWDFVTLDESLIHPVNL